MTRTSVAILSLFCSSALAAAAPQHAAESPFFKPSQTAVKPGAPLPPVQSIRSLFGGTTAKPVAATDSLTLPRLPRPRLVRHQPESWITCGMTVFMADPNVDGKALKKHSSDGFPTRRIEPNTCK